MSIISLIAAVDEQSGLGKNNQLLCHLPADLKYFKECTLGKPIIMGRKTFESIGRPLPGRRNIVLSRNQIHIEGVEVVKNLEEAIRRCEQEQEIMIIGGASIYQQAISLAHKIYLTVIHHRFDADVFFPEVKSTEWQCIDDTKSERDIKSNIEMTFYQYVRKNNPENNI